MFWVLIHIQLCIENQFLICRGGKTNEDNTVSLSLERYDKEVFLFALSRNGQLRVWCCTKMVCVYEFDFTASNQALVGGK